jgi:hypothetical protein
MAGVGAPWPAMGVLTGEGREGEGEGERRARLGALGGAVGGGWAVGGRLNRAAPLFGLPGCCT